MERDPAALRRRCRRARFHALHGRGGAGRPGRDHGRRAGGREGLVPEIVGDRRVVEVAAPDWPAALAAVEREPRLVMLDGTLIRVLGAEPEAVRADLEQAVVSDARVTLVPASLNETLVELSRGARGR